MVSVRLDSGLDWRQVAKVTKVMMGSVSVQSCLPVMLAPFSHFSLRGQRLCAYSTKVAIVESLQVLWPSTSCIHYFSWRPHAFVKYPYQVFNWAVISMLCLLSSTRQLFWADTAHYWISFMSPLQTWGRHLNWLVSNFRQRLRPVVAWQHEYPHTYCFIKGRDVKAFYGPHWSS